MTWNEILKLARKNGLYLVRHGRKHDIYGHDGRDDEMQLERHGSQEVRPGLLKKLIKQIEGK